MRRTLLTGALTAAILVGFAHGGIAHAFAPKYGGSCPGGCTLTLTPDHGPAGASFQATLTFNGIVGCTALPQVGLYWQSGALLQTATMQQSGASSCSAYFPPAAPPTLSPGPNIVWAAYTDSPAQRMTEAKYVIDSINESVAPSSGVAGSAVKLSYSYQSTSCPGPFIEFYWSGQSGSPLATTSASANCSGSVAATIPSSAQPGTYQVWGMLATSAAPVGGTQVQQPFTVTPAVGGGTSGGGSPPTAFSGGGTTSGGTTTSGGATSSGSTLTGLTSSGSAVAGATVGGSAGSGSTANSGSTATSPVAPSGGNNTAPGATPNVTATQALAAGPAASPTTAPTDISALDLTGAVALGRVDPVSSLVGGASGTLWPVLLVIDLLAVSGIVWVARRWRREEHT